VIIAGDQGVASDSWTRSSIRACQTPTPTRLDAQQHYGENIGDTDSQAIFVELKDSGPTTATGIGESRLGPQPRE
jgi:hypothetical protein